MKIAQIVIIEPFSKFLALMQPGTMKSTAEACEDGFSLNYDAVVTAEIEYIIPIDDIIGSTPEKSYQGSPGMIDSAAFSVDFKTMFASKRDFVDEESVKTMTLNVLYEIGTSSAFELIVAETYRYMKTSSIFSRLKN